MARASQRQLNGDETRLSPSERLLNEVEAASRLGVSPSTLATWRCTRRYPLEYVKVGRNVRYREAAILDFISQRTVGVENPESDL